MLFPSPSAAFLLPGLLHQFGNLLLTVQGQAMHVAGSDLAAMQSAVTDVVGRGSASLQIMRALMHERSGVVGDARPLLSTICELGRVAAREHNINLRALADDGATGPVDVEHFVNACTEMLQGFLDAMPVAASDASSPVVRVTLAVAEEHALVTVRFDATEGALPFPMPFEELKSQLAASLAQADASVTSEIQSPAPEASAGSSPHGSQALRLRIPLQLNDLGPRSWFGPQA
ncbi:MAG: hypothetical protein AB8H80_02970 [Planctomycetota bacterium]